MPKQQASVDVLEGKDYKFSIGQRIWFSSEKRPYKVKACDDRFVICTKPFNAQKTVLYTIIDLKRGERGTENLIFCMGFETEVLCRKALERLQKGESEVSHRNYVKLDIIRIDDNNTQTKKQ